MSSKNSESPNIAFVGAKDGSQPLRSINNGSSTIELPIDQSKPFFHEDAAAICKMYGWLYKRVRPIGPSQLPVK